MPHQMPLIATLVAGFGLAFLLGLLAHRLRLSPLVGYLLAGVLIGPFTPGFVADQNLAPQLAEIGVILLMFGVGLHFSAPELLAVRAVAVPGAIGQMAIVSLLGAGLAFLLGWSSGEALVFGLALSVASTVAVLRTLQERRLLETERGRITVGWLIIQDLVMVFTLVLLPPLAGLLGGRPAAEPRLLGSFVEPQTVWGVIALTVAKLATFIAVMLVFGRRLTPLILHYVVHTGSRELFRLAVLAIALGVAYGSAELFGVSFALGAFFAGLILAESELSQRAAQESLPLRDAFAVLFFVSIGMLVDPTIFVRQPGPVFATFLIIVLGNALAAFGMAYLLRAPLPRALMVAASLSQIGEFSFILAGLGVSLKLLPDAGRDFILAGAILSILVNPLMFYVTSGLNSWLSERNKIRAPVSTPEPQFPVLPATRLSGHAILIGYGRVGRSVAEVLLKNGQPLLVVEEQKEIADQLRAKGIEVIEANAVDPGLLQAMNVAAARWLITAIPNALESGSIIEEARALNPNLQIIARAHSDEEVEHLTQYGANLVIMGEREIARGITNYVLDQIKTMQQ
jgi:monovalent cation:H+ antiporter-2, CPA2 family